MEGRNTIWDAAWNRTGNDAEHVDMVGMVGVLIVGLDHGGRCFGSCVCRYPNDPDAGCVVRDHRRSCHGRTNGKGGCSGADSCVGYRNDAAVVGRDRTAARPMIPRSHILSTQRIEQILSIAKLERDGEVESLDLTAAALLEPDAMMERSRLASRGFVHGRAGRWETADGDVVTITVHQVADEQQARFANDDVHETLRAARATIHRRGSTSFTATLTDDGADSIICSVAGGAFHTVIVTGSLTATFALAPIERLAAEQSRLLLDVEGDGDIDQEIVIVDPANEINTDRGKA